MKKYYYDLHIHSCLSPCADDDNTPNSLAGMAKICGLDIVALTDHNSCKNCPAFFEAAERYGIIPVAGMELTTSEDIHVICLFEELEAAMEFDAEIQKHRTLIENRTDIFGNQLIVDSEDNVISEEKYFLSVATDISVEEAPALVERFGGICYPAHIDRQSNGIISVLGTLPETPCFTAVEINRRENIEEYVSKYNLYDKHIIVSSDAHCLTDIRDKENCFELDSEDVRHGLFKELKR